MADKKTVKNEADDTVLDLDKKGQGIKGKERYGSKVTNNAGKGWYVYDRSGTEVYDGPFTSEMEAKKSKDSLGEPNAVVGYGDATDKGYFIK